MITTLIHIYIMYGHLLNIHICMQKYILKNTYSFIIIPANNKCQTIMKMPTKTNPSWCDYENKKKTRPAQSMSQNFCKQ